MQLTDKQKGIICIIFSAFFFAAMNLCAKSAGNLPSIQKAFFRNSIAALVACTLILKHRKTTSFRPKNVLFLIVRAILGTTGIVSNFYAVTHLGLADASILVKLAPFFAIIFSFVFLHEKIVLSQLIAALCAFSASLLIIKPSGALSAHSIAAYIACLSGMATGGSYTCIRYLSKHKEEPLLIVFFFSMFSTVVLLPFFIIVYQPMTLVPLLLLITTGLTGAAGQFFITSAYSYAAANSIAAYDYTHVLFSAIFGFVFFADVPDIYSIAGYIIICGIAVLLFLRKEKPPAADRNYS